MQGIPVMHILPLVYLPSRSGRPVTSVLKPADSAPDATLGGSCYRVCYSVYKLARNMGTTGGGLLRYVAVQSIAALPRPSALGRADGFFWQVPRGSLALAS